MSEALTLAQDPQTPPEQLKRFAQSSDQEIARAAMRNPTTPLPVLVHLVEVSFYREETPREVARHPAASPELLERLSFAKDPQIRAQVASNPRTPSATRERLCEDPRPNVREAAKRVITEE